MQNPFQIKHNIQQNAGQNMNWLHDSHTNDKEKLYTFAAHIQAMSSTASAWKNTARILDQWLASSC